MWDPSSSNIEKYAYLAILLLRYDLNICLAQNLLIFFDTIYFFVIDLNRIVHYFIINILSRYKSMIRVVDRVKIL